MLNRQISQTVNIILLKSYTSCWVQGTLSISYKHLFIWHVFYVINDSFNYLQLIKKYFIFHSINIHICINFASAELGCH